MKPPAHIQHTGRLLGRLRPTLAARWAEHLTLRPRIRRRPQRQDALPAGEPLTLRFGLRALRWGDGGPCVLALHGWEGHPDQFRPLGNRISRAGGQLFALYAPGHGLRCDRVAHPGRFADALGEAAAELGPLAAVVGHSMGASGVMLALARGLPAERGVLLAGPAGFTAVLERIALRLGLPAKARRLYLARMETHTEITLAATQPDRLLESVTAPLLVVHDRDDRQVPFGDALDIVRGAPRARLVETRGLGHGRILSDPGLLDEIAGFVDA